MQIRKYTDWRTWLQGLQTNIIKCVGTTGTAWIGTNAASAAGIPITGISWKQAGVMFGVHVGFEAFTYMKNFQPQVITETVETTHTTKDSAGNIETGSSKTTTTIPVETTKP